MQYISLFSGIGGFDLGFDQAGMECVLQVEKDEKARAVLAHHWPNVPKMELVEDVTRESVRQLRIETVDLICGGFPCQPISEAGLRQAQNDERWLWPEYFRVVCEFMPRWVVIENVSGLLDRGGCGVLRNLAQIGYDAEWQALPASAFGAPHIRERVLIVAYPSSFGRMDAAKIFDRVVEEALPQSKEAWGTSYPKRGNGGTVRLFPDSELLRVDDGFPSELDKARVTQLGNAIVPQITEWIGRRIRECNARSEVQ